MGSCIVNSHHAPGSGPCREAGDLGRPQLDCEAELPRTGSHVRLRVADGTVHLRTEGIEASDHERG